MYGVLPQIMGKLRRMGIRDSTVGLVIAEDRRAIEGANAANRAFLLADFHVCLTQQMGARPALRRG